MPITNRSDLKKTLPWTRTRALLLSLWLFSGCATLPQKVSPFAQSSDGPLLLAHRGVSQTFDPTGVTNESCTATRIYPPTHQLLENTLASLTAAFAAGADVVEIDVHPTTDGEFAVFHDWRLECRTDGSGLTRAHSMAELKKLDIGYGYTADGGKTFPFRGQGVGLMPTLAEVIHRFPGRPLLINVKSNDPQEGKLLVAYLKGFSANERKFLAVYGGEAPIAIIREQLPDVLTLSLASLKACLLPYFVLGWTGLIPASCERSLILVPVNYADGLFGWPADFVNKMKSVGSAVFVVGPFDKGPTTGIDTLEALRQLPPDFAGGIWTNEIERLGSALHPPKNKPHPRRQRKPPDAD